MDASKGRIISYHISLSATTKDKTQDTRLTALSLHPIYTAERFDSPDEGVSKRRPGRSEVSCTGWRDTRSKAQRRLDRTYVWYVFFIYYVCALYALLCLLILSYLICSALHTVIIGLLHACLHSPTQNTY